MGGTGRAISRLTTAAPRPTFVCLGSPATLQSALRLTRVTAPLPPALPIAHLTVARWLRTILANGELRPQHCTVFGKDLLYFSYGGLFYRPKRLNTQHPGEWPVGMVFAPGALHAMRTLYPFDTGAMADNQYFKEWKRKLAPFRTRFRVSTRSGLATVPRLVKVLYDNNRRYIEGRVSPSARRQAAPIPLLASFLGADMTPHADHRQRSFEFIADTVFPLGEHLEWIGVPNRAVDKVAQAVYQWTAPRIPEIYPYSPTRNFNPAEIAAQLEAIARAKAIERYVDFKP